MQRYGPPRPSVCQMTGRIKCKDRKKKKKKKKPTILPFVIKKKKKKKKNDNYPCDGIFLLWVYFPLLLLDVVNRGLELSAERKLNTFITDYIDSRFIIYKSARYVPFVQCRR